jgi:hypothetical protein
MTTARHRRLRLAAAAVLGVGGLMATAGAIGAGATATMVSQAVAVNEGAQAALLRHEWMVSQVDGSVTARNVALAVTTCDGCRAGAATIQIVLVSHADAPIDVANEATALDLGCARCEASANAHQFIAVSDGSLQLSPEGHRQLLDLGEAFDRLGARPPAGAGEELAAVDQLAAQVEATLAAELRAVDLPSGAADSFQPAAGEAFRLRHEHTTRTTPPPAG